MKFAQYLNDNLVPEWRAQYLDYKVGKKKLKRINRPDFLKSNRSLKTPQLDGRQRGYLSTYQSPYPVEDSRREVRTQRSRPDEAHMGNLGHISSHGQSESIASAPSSFHLPSPALDDYKFHNRSKKNSTLKLKDAEPMAPSPLKKQVASQNAHNERTPLLEPITEQNGDMTLTRKKSVIENLNDNASSVFKTIRRHSSFLNMDNITQLARRHSLVYNEDDFIQLQNSFDTDRKEFLVWLDSELMKIDSFFKEKESQSVERYLLLQDQLHQLRQSRAKEKDNQKFAKSLGGVGMFSFFHNVDQEVDPLTRNESDLGGVLVANKNKAVSKIHRYELPTLPRLRFLKESESDEEPVGPIAAGNEGDDKLRPNNTATNQSSVDDPLYNRRDYVKKTKIHQIPPYNQAKRQLKHALLEFYRSLELLKGYRSMNRTACRKMIKKFDKTTDSNCLPEFMNKVDCSYFATSPVLDELMTKVEDLYSFYLENGNRKIAVEKLRSKLKMKEHYLPLFLGGLFIGGSIPMIIFTSIKGAQNKAKYPEFNYLFQIWGGFLIATMTALAFTIHFFVWDTARINYKFIFDFNAKTVLDYRQYILMPSMFLIIGSIISYFSFESSGRWPDKFYPRDLPWIFVGLFLIVFLNPFPVLYYKSRRWMQIAIWRLVFSGFYPVEFKDFFIGDIFCSLTYSMSNISFFICLYATHWHDAPRCGSGRSRLMGFLSTLPSIWRLLQCFRRYADTGEWFPHLANMLKYSVSVLYYMTLSIYRIEKHNSNKKAAFIVFAVVNSLYSSFWDIFMDWSLMQFDSKNRFLRNNLGYKNKNHLYYMAMAADVILRFQWVFYVFFTRRIQASTLTSFGVAAAEFIRRFIWVFFRMENEHCTNVNLLKAAREIPLPYPLIHRKSLHAPGGKGETLAESPDRRRYPIGDEELRIGVHLTPDQKTKPKPLTPSQENVSAPQDTRRLSIASETLSDDEHGTANRYNEEHDLGEAQGYQGTPKEKVQSLFRTISRAITVAHAKDFQRPKRKANVDDDGSGNSSDEDDDDDEDGESRQEPDKPYDDDAREVDLSSLRHRFSRPSEANDTL